ncbi:hypothetical protein [Thomasclavelia cocleata]|uniref:hypothetical protein n=1 Tax=Thomasclavelia cocleata TaxID=69824 RepID=UPI00256F3239|nr:hypothetical protein [Thomasclavelia cocleata]
MKLEDLNLTEEELEDLEMQLYNRKKRQQYEENIKQIDENKKYIGKCYKEKDRDKYIRVLSSKSSNSYRLECMCFCFPVSFKEVNRLTKIFNPDNAFSEIDFEGIYIEDYPLLCCDWVHKKGNVLASLEEISEDEYFKKMNEYIEELQKKVKEGYFDTSKNNKSMFSEE